MELAISKVEDKLIQDLEYRLPQSANFITDRTSVQFNASGTSSYSPSLVRTMRFNLTDSHGWIDPSTVRLQFTVTNNDAAVLNHHAAWCFIDRVRVSCGGVQIEDIPLYNRLHSALSLCQEESRLKSDLLESRISANLYGDYNVGVNTAAASMAAGICKTNNQIAAAASSTIMFKPLIGLFTSNTKYIPLRYAPLVIEFDIVASLNEPLLPTVASAAATQSWTISTPVLFCDLVRLDSQLEEDFALHLAKGGEMIMNYSCWTHQQQTLPSASNTVNVSRSFTRLRNVLVNFQTSATEPATTTIITTALLLASKKCFDFCLPSGTFTAQLQIGAKLFPQKAISTTVEAYTQIRKAVGFNAPVSGFLGLGQMMFNGDGTILPRCYMLLFNTEKCQGAGFTGYNCKSGDLISLRLENCIQNNVCYTGLNYDAVLKLTNNGVVFLD